MIKRDMFKKAASLLFILTLLFSSIFAPVAKAQVVGSQWYDPSFQDWNNKVFESPPNEIFGERYTYAQVKWILYSLTAIVTGLGSEATSCFMNNDLNKCLEMIQEETFHNRSEEPLTEVGTFADQLSRVPISGVYYFKNVAAKLKLIPEANAQEIEGFGFGQLNPILGLWKATRNITYAIFILIIVALAFMIMFRVKISPQTVITVQSALPKVAIALVLVTFSYAIAGLLIDLVYVVIGIITTLLIQSGFFAETTNWQTLFNLLTNGPFGTGAFGLLAWYYALFPLMLIISLLQAVTTLSGAGIITGILGGLLLPVIILVVGFVVLWATLKLLWLLFKTFATIILLVIVAPFTIALGAIVPGAGFGMWLKAILSNLAVYPVVGLMMSLAFIFLFGSFFTLFTSLGIDIDKLVQFSHSLSPIDFNHTLLQGDLWRAPLTAGAEMSSLLWLGVSFVLLIMTPQAAELIKSIVQGQPFAYGTAFTEALGMMRQPAAYQLKGLSKTGRLPFYKRIPGYSKIHIPDEIESPGIVGWAGSKLRKGAKGAADTLESRKP